MALRKRYRIRKFLGQYLVYDTADNTPVSYFTQQQHAIDWALYLNAKEIENRL